MKATMSKPPRIFIPASSVAAVIGRHRYRTRGEALLELLDRQRDTHFQTLQEEIRSDPGVRCILEKLGANMAASKLPAVVTRARSDATAVEFEATAITSIEGVRRELVESEKRLASEIQRSTVHHVAIRDCAHDSSAALLAGRRLEAESTVCDNSARKARAEASIILRASPVGRSFKEISRRVKAFIVAKKLRLEAEKDEEAAETKRRQAQDMESLVTSSPIAATKIEEAQKWKVTQLERQASAASALACASNEEVAAAAGAASLCIRGEIQEQAVLDSVAMRENTDISSRNTKTEYLNGPGFVLVGRIDGATEDGRIVEVKTRKNWFFRAPDYDIVQLQVYLRMRRCQAGVLEERSQKDPALQRSTPVVCNESTWKDMETALTAAADELRTANLDVVRAWLDAS